MKINKYDIEKMMLAVGDLEIQTQDLETSNERIESAQLTAVKKLGQARLAMDQLLQIIYIEEKRAAEESIHKMIDISDRQKQFQSNPESIETETVQLWTNGVMMTAQLSKSEAQRMVREKRAYVITSQAIGSITNGRRNG